MDVQTKIKLFKYLSSYLTERRKNLFLNIIQYRTQHVTVVLEDFFQPHNFSAVLRSCDCFGIQDVHIIENQNKYQTNPKVNMGADKWVNIYHYNKEEKNTKSCLKSLKQAGYKIAATHVHKDGISLNDFKPQEKTAIVFGTELTGVSQDVVEMADTFIKIPMYGFTESYNVSVAAALTLSHVRNVLNQNPDGNWKLKEEQQINILLEWAKRSLNNAEAYEKEFHINEQLSDYQ